MRLRRLARLSLLGLRLLGAAGLAFSLQPTPMRAQVLNGSVVGTVEDQSGAVVPRAAVTLTSKETGVTREASTDESGRFSMPSVPPGRYDLTVKAAGFKSATRADAEVVINNVLRADMRLEVGGATEQVTISADAVLLQTDKSDVRSEISTKAVTDLPLPAYRNYQSLLNLVPGTTPARFQNAVTDSPARALETNVNGTARNNNSTRLDGAINVFVWLPHHVAYVAPAETIETVNISTNSFDAEQGMAGGAAITVVTKSGTNQFHGVGFAYHDNQKWRSRNFFLPASRTKPRNTTNIDGGVLSGPIIKNKLFFFGGWEGTFERSGFFGLYTLPTADQRRGDFSAYSNNTTLYDPLTGNATGGGRTAFAGNVIPPNRISPTAQQLQALLPLPNLAGTVNNFAATGTQGLDRHNFDGKINWNRSASHTIWGKYSHMDALVTCAYAFGDGGGPGLCSGGPGTGDTVVKLVTVGHTLTLSPSLILDGNFGYNRMDQVVSTPDYGTNIGLDTFRIPGTNGPDLRQSGLPAFLFPNAPYTNFGNTNNWQPAFRNDDSYTGTTNLAWIRGKHDLRFGFDVVRHALNHWQPELSNPRGAFNFNTAITGNNEAGAPALNQYNAYAGFLLGLPQNATKSLQHLLMTTREWQLGFYARDRFQATRNLTLNLGLRYEYYPLLTRAERGIERWDGATNRVLIGGEGSTPDNVGVTVSKKLFAPRVGFAYRLGDKTVIRSGYGVTYNPLPVSRPLRGPYPATIAATFQGVNTYVPFAPLSQGIPAFSGPDVTSGSVPLPGNVENRSIYPGLLHRGYIQSWNFIVERRLPGSVVTSVGYVGTKTVRGFGDREINAAGPGQGNAGRPLAASLGRTVSTTMWDGYLDTNYHSLQTSFNRQFSSGLLIKGAYTFSKAMNIADEDGWTGAQTFNWGPVWYRNYARAGYDRPHAFTAGFVYELPFGKGKPFLSDNFVGRYLLGGWQTNGVFAAYSGVPFTVTADGARLNAPGNTQTADQVKTTVEKPGGIGLGTPYFDPTAYAGVNEVRFGTSGRNSLRGPGLVNLDASLFRNFAITERWNLQFKGEAFNVSNTPKFANPNANVNSPANFGAVTSTLANYPTERQFRLGLRLSF